MPRSIIDEIYDEIKKQNSADDTKAIPHSDVFIRKVSALVGATPELVKQIIQILVNSHKIFSFEIILPDQLRNLPGVYGYVIADLNTIRRLKNIFYKELMYQYTKQFNKTAQVHQIIKEIFPVIRSYNNTPLGIAANKSIMLDEFEKLIEKKYSEYTEDYKEKQLALEISRANLEKLIETSHLKTVSAQTAYEKKTATPLSSALRETGQRAVDSKSYNEFLSKKNKYPLQRIINIYGIDFFYKVNLRNYQFSYLKQLIKDGQIAKRSDLVHLREMLKTVRQNINNDPKLKEYENEIFELERTISHFLYFAPREQK
ncbi:MAG: hypothetical protein N2316_10400 [Spirochaetes bacterium]|nr:hypothetical protein [Spirochaetota bacterium]